MKQLLYIILFSSVFLARAQAGLEVACSTNNASVKDLQDALGIYAYNFTAHRSSLTNGFSIYVETRTIGRSTNVIFQTLADFDKLNSQKAGEDIPVLVIMNPVGSFDGEGILSAKKLHILIRVAGISSSMAVDNPFHNSQGGLATWAPTAARESDDVFKLMEGHSISDITGPATELTVRFYQW